MRVTKRFVVNAVASLATASLLVAFGTYAADDDCKNPLDPKFKSEQQKHSDKWMEMHKKIGKSANAPITEEDYLKLFAEGSPTHPSYQKTKEEWKKMTKAMGIKEGDAISPEQWMDTTNPLHPCYKRSRG